MAKQKLDSNESNTIDNNIVETIVELLDTVAGFKNNILSKDENLLLLNNLCCE